MQKLSETLTEKNWSKGSFNAKGDGTFLPIERKFNTCLMLEACKIGAAERIAEIARQLFPERVSDRFQDSWFIGVAINNHPDTVWSDIEKIIHTYELEND